MIAVPYTPPQQVQDWITTQRDLEILMECLQVLGNLDEYQSPDPSLFLFHRETCYPSQKQLLEDASWQARRLLAKLK